MMIVLTKLNVYAGNAPNATIKYEYSAPEDGIIVPNSAYERAPEIIQKTTRVIEPGRVVFEDIFVK